MVVEDIPSAVRAAAYCNSVALCGTGCGTEAVAEIAQTSQRVIWALDADATGVAVELQRRHSLMFAESKVLVLERDLKDMTEEELCHLMNG